MPSVSRRPQAGAIAESTAKFFICWKSAGKIRLAKPAAEFLSAEKPMEKFRYPNHKPK